MPDLRTSTGRSSGPDARTPDECTGSAARKKAPRPRGKALLLLVIPLIALAVLYAANPRARELTGSALNDLFDKISSLTVRTPEPDPTQALLADATRHIARKNWADAESVYQQLHELHPDAVDVWFGLGLCRHNLQDFEGAIEANLKAIAEPNHLAATAAYSLAAEYALTGRTDESFRMFDRAFQWGYRNAEKLASDPALDSLRGDPRFRVPPMPEYHTFTSSDGRTVQYALVLPDDFDEARSYPALLGLAGARQDRNFVDEGLTNYWGVQASLRGWIVVSPVSRGGGGFFHGDDYRLIPELLDDLSGRARIEGGRFHAAGFSNGGTASFNVATAFPEYFQSVTAFPVYEITPETGDRLDALRGMKVRLFYGELDGGPSVEATTTAHRRLRALGIDSVLTPIPEDYHVPLTLMCDELMKFLDTLRSP